jgi:hypothetical protein
MRYALAAFVAFVLGLFVGGVMRPNHEQEAIRMRAQARGWYAIAASMQRQVDTQYVTITKTITVEQKKTDTVLQVLREQRPECADVVDTCEERIAVERGKLSSLEGLFQKEKQVADLYRRSADTALSAIDKALKGQSFGYRLFHPELRPGVFAGACIGTEGVWKPCVGGGLTLSWRF